jgi:hypothetical protein
MRIATTRLDVEVEILPLMRMPVPDQKIRLSPKKADKRPAKKDTACVHHHLNPLRKAGVPD